jgi:hypothetical protein
VVGYKTQSLDTTREAEIFLFELWRSWSLSQKSDCLNSTTYNVRETAWYLSKTQSGYLDQDHQIRYFFDKVATVLPHGCVTTFSHLTMIGVIEEALIVTKVLDSLNIAYFIGGSVASGIWGELRYTQDLDLVADIQFNHIQALLAAFSERFYISDSAVREAIDRERSFNLIDNNTGWKIDIFVLAQNIFQQNQLKRRQAISVNEKDDKLYFSSAEDTVLQKILWYRLSQRQSEQQWRDILGILKLQSDRLDLKYLQDWAQSLSISQDLETALNEAGF